jgi:hypothetical protein
MRIECNAMKLTLKVRGQPKVHGQLLEFVRSLGKRHPRSSRPAKQVTVNGQHYYKSYSRSA